MLHPLTVEPIVRAALAEDLGRAGDITTDSIIPADAVATARIATRKDGRVAGLEAALIAFRLLDPAISVTVERADGDDVAPGGTIASLTGKARALLTAERTALNLMGRLSGIATATRALVREVEGTKARIVCTRKTTPGLRVLEKHAVKLGGGFNHRFGLDDAVLIKDNHIAVAGGVAGAIRAARAFAGHLVRVEVEVTTLEELEEALEAQPDVILLDNMGPELLRRAVEINRDCAGLSDEAYAADPRRVKLEASGNVNIATIRAIAETGVDYISTSKITMAAPTLDIGLDIVLR